jgi:hypothetical protein
MRTTEKFIVLDVETANDTVDALTYDIGFIVADRHGNIYECHSFCVYDIYCCEKDLMQSAYYAKKLPLYEEGLKNGEYKLAKFSTVKNLIWQLMKEYNITKVFAYNCNFDRNALTKTQRWLTKSKYRWFFPYDTEFCDIWNFACSTICQQKGYKDFCELNGYISNRGNNYRSSAECVYQFITNQNTFEELHQGLADVYIEYEILLRCYATHRKVETDIDKACWRKVERV